MARKKKNTEETKVKVPQIDAYIQGAGQVVDEKITITLEKNYMPYAMSVNVSRSFPEIDGFKPSHRKLLYTMYKMGLLQGAKMKSANVVGRTMQLNPHGDAAIYETMVRLARGNETLLHPYVESKGNFGKAYSRDMAYAASRYTEVKLEPICNELFKDIDKNTVDFVPNYDNTMQEPTLFPATFPSVLVNANVGIGVAMASSVCSFNLAEICETTIALMRNPEHNALETLKGPDFAGGSYFIYDEEELDKVYQTGRGSLKFRAKYSYDKSANCIDITQIPPTATIEVIIEKIVALVKAGKIKDIQYIRDETDINGLHISIDLKRGADPEKLMQKLFKMTPLQDTYACNFNILVNGYPKVMGVYEIIREWVKFRMNCVKRRVDFDLRKKEDKLHLLLGLEKILLDIDKAVKIVRETENESDVVPNLMVGFGIDQIQAEYVAEIKLRHLNREYILNRTKEIQSLIAEIADMKDILGSDRRIKGIIIDELKEVSNKYGQARKTEFIYAVEEEEAEEIDDVPDYQCKLFVSESGYFKKITPQSLRMSGAQKVKEGDEIKQEIEATNKTELLFFTDKATVYKSRASSFEDSKASALGDYIPAKLSFDDGESFVTMVPTTDYKGYLLFVYENGKVAKVPMSAYETKTNRKKLTNAYSEKSKLISILYVEENANVLIKSSNGRMIIFNSALMLPKASRDTIGVATMTLKAKSVVEKAYIVDDETAKKFSKYIVKNIPAAGPFAKDIEDPDQMTF
ncbi:MAG: topoisomerase IV [Oscillospiraceae bacterium]|nr:topoisomerase IV [Oscillospiraceae bacterium]